MPQRAPLLQDPFNIWSTAPTPAQIASLFAPFLETVSPRPLIALAVSGGADSMALLYLTQQAISQKARIICLTVDHQLRAESRQEAAQIAAYCNKTGIPHETLVWSSNNPPVTGIQATARTARYQLLITAAQKAGAAALVTAHQADDQAETYMQRLAKGAGPAGLAGMRSITHIAAGAGKPLALWRPFLPVRRQALADVIQSQCLPVCADPSNQDAVFERVRWRGILAALDAQNHLHVPSLCRSARQALQMAVMDRQAARVDFTSCAGVCFGTGAACLSWTRFRQLTDFAQYRLLRLLVHAVSGRGFAPAHNAVETTLDILVNTRKATLGGVLIQQESNALWFLREPAAVLGRKGELGEAPLHVSPDSSYLWDGRFICQIGTAQSGELRPLGHFFQEKADTRAKAVCATLPGLFQGNQLVGQPVIQKNTTPRPFATWNPTLCTLHTRSLVAERLFSTINRF